MAAELSYYISSKDEAKIAIERDICRMDKRGIYPTALKINKIALIIKTKISTIP
jgi:hypothetical protein